MRRCLLLVLPAACCTAQGIITTVAGTTWIFRDNLKPATQAALGRITDVAFDSLGNIHAVDRDNHVAFIVRPGGNIEVTAGNGVAGFSGEGGPAIRASLNRPSGLWLSSGNLYIADVENNRIRRRNATGSALSTFAGNGLRGYSGDGGPATAARINLSSAVLWVKRGITSDAAGNIYFSDTGNHRVRKIDPNGIITTYAGTGTAGFSGDTGPATAAQLNEPAGLFMDRNGALFIADRLNYRVRRVSSAGVITTVAGNGQRRYCGDAGPATAACLSEVSGVYVEPSGAFILADFNNQRIRRVDASGTITTIAGSGTLGFAGDGGPALQAGLEFPSAVFVDSSGGLLIADTDSQRIRRVRAGVISTVAGNGRFKFSGDGVATSATLYGPLGITSDPAGTIYVADYNNKRVRRLNTDRTLTTIAGTGVGASSGDNGLAINASFRAPAGVARDTQGNLYVVDISAQRVRKINPQGIITTVAGTGGQGFSGDGGPALNATFDFRTELAQPAGVAVDAAGNLYVADIANHRIRRITPGGIISTFAGNGIGAFAGDTGPAAAASLNIPVGVAVDSAGNVYIADKENHRIRRVAAATGVITTVAGSGVEGFGGDGGPATGARLNEPKAVAFDGRGGYYIADTGNRRIRYVDAAGVITTVAGRGASGSSGDGGQSVDATLTQPSSVAVDPQGNLYISDTSNDRLRQVLAARPTFSIAPASVRFSIVAGSPGVATQRVSVGSSVTGLAWAAQAATESGGGWLSLTPAAGGAPGTLDVGVQAGTLAAGTYRGTVTVQSPASATPPQTVTVELEITGAASSRLAMEPAALSFDSAPGGAAPPPKTLRIANAGGGSLAWTGQVSTASGGNWLAISPNSGSVTSTTPAGVQVQVTTAGLAAGVYEGSIRVETSAGAQSAKVTLLLGAAAPTILLSQTGLQFTGVEGSRGTPLQTFGVLNTGPGTLNWTAEASTLSGGNWLSVTPASGSVAAGSLDIPELEVSVNVTGLRAGQYSGLVKVSATGATNSPQFVTVDFTVLRPDSKPGIIVRPTGLIFAARAGAASPGSKIVRVATAGAGNIDVRGGLLTFDGGNWLETLPLNVQLAADSPATLTVQPQLGTLTPGIYRAAVTLLFDDGSPSQVVNALFAVVAPPTPAGAEHDGTARADCAPQRLLGLHSTLGNGFAARVGSPTPIGFEVIDDCGHAVPNASVVATFTNNDPPLTLVSLGDGSYTGTWRPASAAGSTTVSVRASLGSLAALELAATGSVADNPQAPAVFPGGVVNAASFAGGQAMAPGGIISLFGRKVAANGAAAAIPLPRMLGDTTVSIGGMDAPLYFTSEGQINLQLPFELAPNSRPQVIVKTRAGTGVEIATAPEIITVADVRPGIFTANQSGQGQGIVLLNDRLADAASPARAGDVVVVYCTGLGATNPPVASGEASPGNPPGRTVAGVSATVGGAPAIVDFAGLTPGFVGLYQVNLRIPAGLAQGDAVPLVLIQNNAPSNAVTLAVRHWAACIPRVPYSINIHTDE